jgi:type I restriction enzyme R subunit
MAKINEAERKTQKHVLKLFQDELDYVYYGDLRHQINSNIMVDKLTAWLTSPKGGGHSASLADRAISELQKVTGNLQHGLYKANQDVYSLLKYGAKVKENPGEPEKTVYFIDWKHSHNNEFAIAEEVTTRSNNERRPDLVVYINGIAIAVIELKKSTVSVSQGIRQNLSNQSELFNLPFFATIQFVLAGNTSEGLRYGAIGTKEKYYLEWKNDTVHTEAQPLDDVSLDI